MEKKVYERDVEEWAEMAADEDTGGGRSGEK